MKKLSLTLIIAAAAALGAGSYSVVSTVASDVHNNHTMQSDHDMATSGASAPQETGQSAFAAIAEIVAMLNANPDTDWSKVNISALRAHLVDMDRLTTEAEYSERDIDGAIEFQISGSQWAIDAARRMVPAHAQELSKTDVWSITTQETPSGITMIVKPTESITATKIKALGFFGIMATGTHHQPHHLGMATGTMSH